MRTGEWRLRNNVQSDTWWSSNRSRSCPVPRWLLMSSCASLVMSSRYVILSPPLVVSWLLFHPFPCLFSSMLNYLFATLFFLTHPKSFLSPVPSSTLCPLVFSSPSCTPTLLKHLLSTILTYLKPTDQTKSLHKYQPKSSNQPNCCRKPCLREGAFFAGKHYLMASNQESYWKHAAVSLLIVRFYFTIHFRLRHLSLWLLAKFGFSSLCCN